MTKNTNINWITTISDRKDEWIEYSKNFFIEKEVENAVIRFESDSVCAIFINDQFIVSSTGRTPERVNCHQVYSFIKKGENNIKILLGGHYFQGFGLNTRQMRGYWMNQAAMELAVSFSDGTDLKIVTDKTWGEKATETMQITEKEYNLTWKNALCWPEKKDVKIPDEVLKVAGEEYENYIQNKCDDFIDYEKIVETDMSVNDGVISSTANENYIILDFGKTVVGYVEINFNSNLKVDVYSLFDLTEQLTDFNLSGDWAYNVERLRTKDVMSGGFYRNYRRRAFRYLKLAFNGQLKINSIKVRPCMFPQNKKGWFNCSDRLLNQIWETGKYTFHLIKQQEYESCPRCEMLFFAGDGVIDASIDNYVFGDCRMLNTSLSLRHEEKAAGISTVDSFNRTVWQWDYLAWRIISVYEYFCRYGEKSFLEEHYDEIVTNILWLTERMNNNNLLFQTPAFHSTFSSTLIQVDWACSIHRLGENVFLNCLLYKSLLCMSELAKAMNDKRTKEWGELAEKVKDAVNTRLFDKEKEAYIDGLDDAICQDSNVLAVFFGIADEERSEKVLRTLKEKLWSEYGSQMADKLFKNGTLRGGSTTISPTMCAFEAEARFKAEKPLEGITLIRNTWGAMLKKGATTFWEFNPNNATDKWGHSVCHGWSAGCTYLLSAYVLGIRFENEKIIFAPRPCDLEEMTGVVPTEKGFIAAKLKDKTFSLAVPKNFEVLCDIPEKYKVEIIKY